MKHFEGGNCLIFINMVSESDTPGLNTKRLKLSIDSKIATGHVFVCNVRTFSAAIRGSPLVVNICPL